MEISPRTATGKNPPEQFTGDVWLDPIAYPRESGQRMIVALVRFAPGARTAWHSHDRGQTLHVTQGIAWVQSRGGDKVELHAGQTVYCPPGEEHWHGAAPDAFMEHLAMLENADDPATTTTWAAAGHRRGLPRVMPSADESGAQLPATERTQPSFRNGRSRC